MFHGRGKGLSYVFKYLYWCSIKQAKICFFTEGLLRHLFRFSSVAQLCLTLCDPMDCSTPGFRVHHQLLELTQTHVHRVHPTISSSVIPFSSHLQSFLDQGLFQWVSSSHQVVKILLFQLQYQSFQSVLPSIIFYLLRWAFTFLFSIFIDV